MYQLKKLRKKLIQTIVTKKFRPYKTSKKIIERKNLLKQDFSTNKPNEKWVGDITIIGYSFSKTMDSSVAIAALENAYKTQNPSDSVIFHSDLGVQYTSEEFINRLKKYRMKASNERRFILYSKLNINVYLGDLDL